MKVKTYQEILNAYLEVLDELGEWDVIDEICEEENK